MTKTSKPKYNENYTHECSSRLIDRSEIKPSLVDVNYTSEGRCELYQRGAEGAN